MKQLPSKCPTRSKNPISKARDIAYVRLGRKNPELTAEYYKDFGLSPFELSKERVLFHGFSSDLPCWSLEKADRDFLLGFGLYISSTEEFERLRRMDGAEVWPQGRFGTEHFPTVTIKDPSGLPVDAVLLSSSFTEKETDRKSIHWNCDGKILRKNQPQPWDVGPAKVNRLGHAVFLKQEFLKNAQWYCEVFGMIPSDIQILPGSKEPVIAFLRCDLGEELTDHHTIVIAFGIDDRLEHCAFELKDLDEVAKGREWLLKRGWKPAWGIGRHILGSQIFDYQRDPSGMLVEHYTDGDKFDDAVPVGFHLISRESLYQWGQDMPEDFLDTELSLDKLVELVKGIFSGRKIELRKLIELKKVAERSPRSWIKY
ncbi:VOC family protein [Leptospira johnsonii]|uniref:Glyoxalase family protein n=1 Tax=Leptospira johnsonii TaxID=1917820 RepID=A0A2P2D1Q8_9LEPT|nr:VOC family protein [Leptospira johnsonii]GBF38568.1 glyoxalase family protein [Leptospira johnsonii]